MADDPKMSKMITVRMTPELHAAVMAKAHEKGRDFSVSDLLRSALEKWVAK
jgi:Arc/MetJ-type ribon-helix-helix transcriptional regulator